MLRESNPPAGTSRATHPNTDIAALSNTHLFGGDDGNSTHHKCIASALRPLGTCVPVYFGPSGQHRTDMNISSPEGVAYQLAHTRNNIFKPFILFLYCFISFNRLHISPTNSDYLKSLINEKLIFLNIT